MTNNEFKAPEKKLTTVEMAVGVISFVCGGVGLIVVLLYIWNFVENVFG